MRRETSTLQIDALSGKDGRRFWRQRRETGGDRYSSQPGIAPRWWQSGDDGRPSLIVPVAKGVGGQAVTYIFAANTGELVHTLPEVADPQVADINSDGIPDLWFLTKTPDLQRMSVLKGMPPINWRRAGTWRPASDFDGDGVADFLEFEKQHFAARSGRDGHQLWKTPLGYSGVSTLVDVNGDKIDDVVIMENQSRRLARGWRSYSYEQYTALIAYSGKTGERIWGGPDCGLSNGGSSYIGGYPDEEYSFPMFGSRDLDGDGRPELLFVGSLEGIQTALAAFSSRDGSLMWKIPVDENSLKGQGIFDRIFQDLNNDGVLDVVFSVPKTVDPHGNLTVAGLRAFSGRDGTPLWLPCPADRFPFNALLRGARPVLGDLDGDGFAEVVVAASERNGADPATGLAKCVLIVLDGRTGEQKWSWTWITDGQFTFGSVDP